MRRDGEGPLWIERQNKASPDVSPDGPDPDIRAVLASVAGSQQDRFARRFSPALTLGAGRRKTYRTPMREDIERVLIDEEVIHRRLDTMAEEIEREFPPGPLLVIILLKGALVFAADLLRRVPRVLELECLNVASYHGGTESSGTVDFLDRHDNFELENLEGYLPDEVLVEEGEAYQTFPHKHHCDGHFGVRLKRIC